MVPTLGISKEGLKNNNFLNGYIKDERRDIQYENSVYLLFKPTNLDKFKDFLDYEYERTPDLIDDYDYEGGFIVVVYKLNSRFRKDFELIKRGQYSKTSEEFQEIFPKSVIVVEGKKSIEKMSLQHRIFNKTEDMIEYWEKRIGVDFDHKMEVWRGWENDKEILELDKIKVC